MKVTTDQSAAGRLSRDKVMQIWRLGNCEDIVSK